MSEKMYKMTMVMSENDKAAMEEFMRQMNITANLQVCEEKGSTPTTSTVVAEEEEEPIPDTSTEENRESDPKCPHCFMIPCVGTSNQTARWMGKGNPPSDLNSSTRKGLYYKFWKVISCCGGWNFPEYTEKKARLGGGTVYHQREIIPDCVLSVVRQAYPNRKNQPYMGHKWW